MKKSPVLILTVVLIAFGGVALGAIARTALTAPGGEDVDRYRIVHIQTLNDDGEDFPLIFRIDSMTGKSWRYVPPIEYENDVVEGWLQVPEIIDRDLLEDEDERFLP